MEGVPKAAIKREKAERQSELVELSKDRLVMEATAHGLPANGTKPFIAKAIVDREFASPFNRMLTQEDEETK